MFHDLLREKFLHNMYFERFELTRSMRSMIDTILLQFYYDRRDRTEMVNLGTEPSQ